MKLIHVLVTSVLLGGVAAASFSAAQNPTPPQPTDQQEAKGRVGPLEPQLKEAQVKADRAAMEKDCIERIEKQYEESYKKALSKETTLDHAKTLLEILAYGAALVFFLYKAIAGYLITQMGLTIACKRAHSTTAGHDHLAIVATLKKGKTGTLTLHDGQARLTLPGGSLPPIELIGLERLTFDRDTHKWPGTTRRKIEWRLSESNPFLNLAPGDQGQFSCLSLVPSDAAVKVEVVILGQRWGSKYRSQWRSSTISLPVQP